LNIIHYITIFALFSSFSLAEINAQLVHKDAPEFYKMTASNLRWEDLPKIKYNYHAGEVTLKTGQKYVGDIKFVDRGDKVPLLNIKESYNNKKSKVEISLVKRMTLAAPTDPMVLTKDSVEFEWLEDYGYLYRKIADGEITVYDNSYIVDEAYFVIPNHTMLAYNFQNGYSKLKTLEDLQEYAYQDPYIFHAAKITGQGKYSQPELILRLVEMYNGGDIANDFNWPEMTIYLNNGSSLRGQGVMQPTDFDKASKALSYGVIHFKDYDNGRYSIFTNKDVVKIIVDDKTYTSQKYAMFQVPFWAIEWTYKEAVYAVAKKMPEQANFFLQPINPKENNLIFLRKLPDGSFKRVENERTLFKAFTVNQ